jgi:biotin operon repressor
MPGPKTELADAIRVIKALRGGPLTHGQIAERLGLPDRKVRRLVEKLKLEGAPIEEKPVERIGERGFDPIGLRITVEGLRDWLG